VRDRTDIRASLRCSVYYWGETVLRMTQWSFPWTTRGCKGTKESTAAADLDYKTSILAAQILVERPEDHRIYDDIAAAGNALLDQSEVGGAQSIEAACHGSVAETADCTTLG
jgi:hypothetical protein